MDVGSGIALAAVVTGFSGTIITGIFKYTKKINGGPLQIAVAENKMKEFVAGKFVPVAECKLRGQNLDNRLGEIKKDVEELKTTQIEIRKENKTRHDVMQNDIKKILFHLNGKDL